MGRYTCRCLEEIQYSKKRNRENCEHCRYAIREHIELTDSSTDSKRFHPERSVQFPPRRSFTCKPYSRLYSGQEEAARIYRHNPRRVLEGYLPWCVNENTTKYILKHN